MHWFFLAFFGYCALCYAVALSWVRVRHPDDAEAQANLSRWLPRLYLSVMLVAPVVVPFVFYCRLRASWVRLRAYFLLREVRTLRRINRTVREYQFIPVDVAEVDEVVRERFERLTPPLEELGFERIGDFRMKPEPVVVHDRIFLSADGETLAVICSLLRAGVVSYLSVLEDGTCVHTCQVHNPHPERTFEPADQLGLQYRPGRHPINLYREHQEALRAAAERQGSRPLQLRRDQYRAIMVYDQRIFNRWRHRHGNLDVDPPAPDFNTLRSPQEATA
jgi:hypothetical protein